MVLLHIASLSKLRYGGVYVAVPQHVISQQQFSDVALINTTNEKIEGVQNQFSYHKHLDIKKLPKPFNDPDLIIIHELYYKEYIAIVNHLIKENFKYIIIPHGCLTKQAQKKKIVKKYIANALCFNRIVHNSIAVQYLSENEKMHSILRNKKSLICGNGVSLPSHIKEKRKGVNVIHINYIGRLETHIKGIDLLFDALNNNKEFLEKNNVNISLYGPVSNKEKEKIRKLKSIYNLKNILYIRPPIFDDDKINLLLNTDYFILPSRTEGLPMGVLEAMSYGIPCIITEGTGLKNVVTRYDAGWVSKTNGKDLGNVIRKAVTEYGNCWIKGKNAKKMIEEKYTWKIIARDAIKKYEQLISFSL